MWLAPQLCAPAFFLQGLLQTVLYQLLTCLGLLASILLWGVWSSGLTEDTITTVL